MRSEDDKFRLIAKKALGVRRAMTDHEQRNTMYHADDGARLVWKAPRLTEHAIIDNTELISTGTGDDGEGILYEQNS